ncbi:MAG: glycosyltransferase [Caulobacteraceae bacterium]|nr:glycosyltransferase [Caulobacteraceae bacterium]
MRIGWYSNAPHIPSGYGQQTAQVLLRMKQDGHEVAVASNHGAAASLTWEGIPVFADGLKQYSIDIFPQQLKAWGGLSIGLFDAWPMMPVAEQLKDLNLAWWVPIDHDPVPPGVVDFFNATGAFAIAMTRFGEEQLLKVGMPKERVTYIPHAIDTKEMFTDVGQGARKQMGIPEDAHLIVMNAANRGRLPIRKAFAENLLALSEHMKKHPDAWAYIHTEPQGISDGMNLGRYLNFIGAPMDRFRWPEPMAFRNGIPTEHLKHVYSAADVVLGTSMGEGFGVPTIEAQACGTPVIVSQFAGSAELAGPHSVLIHGQKMWDEFQGSFWIVPDVRQIYGALEMNYQETKAKAVDRTKVREFALHYDADLIYAKHWRPLIEKLAAPSQPVAPANRAERRASRKSK